MEKINLFCKREETCKVQNPYAQKKKKYLDGI